MRTKLIAAVFALLVTATSAPAQRATADINGVYNGTYGSEHGPIKFKLSLTQQNNGTLAGTFTLYLSEGSATKEYTAAISGRYIAANKMVQLSRGKWEIPPPGDVVVSGMTGLFDPEGGQGAGQISGKMRARPAPEFQAIRDADESAKLASAATEKKESGTPGTPAAQPGKGVDTAKPTAPAAARAPGTYIPRTEIDGVYAGTFGSNLDDKVPAKLYVKFINNGSVNGILDGLFTFEVPPSAGAKPITYTYKLDGSYAVGTMGFGAKPVGNPAPTAYAVKSIYADFDRTPYRKGSNGQLEFDFIPDQITGNVMGDRLSNNKIEAKRDKDESANLDKLMAAAQASAVSLASAVSTTAPAPVPRAVPGVRIVRPNSLVGVFNGTYTRANEPPTKFKLTITRPPEAGLPGGRPVAGGHLVGVATIYLPTGSDIKAYTYSLKGTLDPGDNSAFHLFVNDWETIPPKDFKDFKGMGFSGTFRSNLDQNTARILSAQVSGPNAAFFLPQFEATWDATESQDIQGAIAAQKAVENADQVTALKGRDEFLKNAKPKQLASKDLVRKSRQYWEGFQTDMIREVFDGGFGAAMDENEQFQRVFLTYVGTFSAKCPESLPANHQTVTVTEITSLTVTKNPAWQTWQPEADRYQSSKTERTYTVEMDPRFVAKFNQFHAAINSPGAGLRDVAAAAQPGGVQSVVHERLAIVTDMQKFFADHGGKSAAMRQLNENFLRAINGEPSLQQAGGKIDGAEAESDQDALPGRYARFVDGANAYYLALAKRSPSYLGNSRSHDTALCQRLAELYEVHMTRDEEYYYANDFEGRFLPIMGVRANCPDPAWPQLHPDVEKAIAEVK